MSNKKGIKYNSKSALILKQYTPEGIQKLLNSGEFKSVIIRNLGIHVKAFNDYMRQHNLTYQVPDKPKFSSKEMSNARGEQKGSSSDEEPLERFQRLFKERKQKRTLQELKDAYY